MSEDTELKTLSSRWETGGFRLLGPAASGPQVRKAADAHGVGRGKRKHQKFNEDDDGCS